MSRWLWFLPCAALAACSDDRRAPLEPMDGSAIDTRPPPDGRADAPPPDAPGPDGPPWLRSRTIDGTNDFEAGAEQFLTTTDDTHVYLTFDASTIYLGLETDLASAPTTTWFVACFDSQPGAAPGASQGELVGTQHPSFPNGFRAEHCLKRTLDGTQQLLRSWNGAAWIPNATSVAAAQGSGFVELGLPRAALGLESGLGMVALLLDSAPPERAYGGLYVGAFADGSYAASVVPIAYYFAADLASDLPPNDPRFREP
jgi:hypothetical protein